MKTLEDLTPEIEAKIPEYLAKYTKGVYDGGRWASFNYEDAVQMVNWNYEQCKMQYPFVIVAENPFEAQVYFNFMDANEAIFQPLMDANFRRSNGLPDEVDVNTLLDIDVPYNPLFEEIYGQLVRGLGLEPKPFDKNKTTGKFKLKTSGLSNYNNDYLFTTNIYSNALLAFYMFVKDEMGVECDIEEQLNTWNERYLKSNIYSAIFSEQICVVSKYPQKISVNADNDLHCTTDSAVIWESTFPETAFDNYFVNGRTVNVDIFKKVASDNFTFDEFNRLDNEEDKATVVTMIISNKGNEGLMDFLGAKIVDKQTVHHTEDYSEILTLYKTKRKFDWAMDSNKNLNAKLAWLRMVCPSTQQTYLISVAPDFDNAVEAAKDLRPSKVPLDLAYKWISAN